jgi:hypothetical protein
MKLCFLSCTLPVCTQVQSQAMATNVVASDGLYNGAYSKIHLSCTPLSINTGAYYQFYVSATNNVSTAKLVNNWQTSISFDYTLNDRYTYYFWARSCASANGTNPSDYAAYTQGYAK